MEDESSLMDQLLNTREAAKRLGQEPSTLRGWRCERRGPTFIVLGPRNIKYSASDLQSYIDQRRFVPSVRDTEDTRNATRQKRT